MWEELYSEPSWIIELKFWLGKSKKKKKVEKQKKVKEHKKNKYYDYQNGKFETIFSNKILKMRVIPSHIQSHWNKN